MIVIGAGRKAEHLCDIFELWSEVTQLYDEPRSIGETKHDKPVLDTIIVAEQPIIVVSAVGDTRDKRELVQRFIKEAESKNIAYEWGELIYRTADITPTTHIGEDFIIRKLSCIGTQCIIGDHVSIGPLANLSHHSKVGDYSTICGQAAIGGSVTIGRGVFIGQGASVKPNVRIGDGALIGTGAVVVKDVPPNMVVAGNPAHGSHKFKGLTAW